MVVLIHIVGLIDIHISSLVRFFFFCVYCNSLGFVFGESISYVFREVCVLKWPVTINKFVLSNNNPDHCSAYIQTGCPDYTEAQCRSVPAMQTCNSCRWTFYGTACFTNHVSKTQTGKTTDHQQLSVCTSRRKCGNCRKLLVGRKQQQEHLCGYLMCPSCHHYRTGGTSCQTKTWLLSAWCCCWLGHRALQQG